jgi:hypothetical protein
LVGGDRRETHKWLRDARRGYDWREGGQGGIEFDEKALANLTIG